ncbi:MAG: S-layer homology domain-containing protein [Oscillospiraceae bacterium]|nr:S-layer homology domain-containing protein [Oscillospiraceae bacterium]
MKRMIRAFLALCLLLTLVPPMATAVPVVYIEPGYSFDAIQAAIDNPAVSEIVLLPGEHRAGTPANRFGTGLSIARSDLILRGYDDNVVVNLDNVWGRHVIMISASFDWDTQCCCNGDSGVVNSNIVIRDILFQGVITNTGTHPNSPVVISVDGISGLTLENIAIDTVTTNNFIHDPVGGIWIRNSEDVVIRGLNLSATLPTQGATTPPFPPMPVILLDAGHSWYEADVTLSNITIENVIWPSLPHNRIELWVRDPAYFAYVDLASISLAGFPYIEFIGPAVWMGNGNWWDRQGDHAVFRTTYNETWNSNHDLLEQQEGNERTFYFHPGTEDIHVAVELEIVICETTNTFTIEQVLPDLDLLSDGGRLELVFSFNGANPRGSVLYFDGTPIPIPAGTTSIHAIGRVLFDDFPINNGFVYMREQVNESLVNTHTVTFIVNGVVVNTVEVPNGQTVAQPANPTPPAGQQFVTWLVQGTTTAWNFNTPITADLTLVAQFAPITNGNGNNGGGNNGGGNGGGGSGGGGGGGGTTPPPADPSRQAFLIGLAADYGQPRQINPRGNITRAEVATIFFRLISDEARAHYWAQSNAFDDVVLQQWFNNAVSTTTHMGIFEGVGDDRFAPHQNITRGELAAVIVRFMYRDQIGSFAAGADQFNDITGHWARAYINEAGRQGWVEGPDGLGGPFNPNQPITRAETAAMVNRMFERLIETPSCRLSNMITWPDNANQNSWYFLYMYMASNSYTYRWRANSDTFKELITIIDPRNWAALERPNSRPQDIFR